MCAAEHLIDVDMPCHPGSLSFHDNLRGFLKGRPTFNESSVMQLSIFIGE